MTPNSSLEILDDVTEMLIGYRGFTKRRKVKTETWK